MPQIRDVAICALLLTSDSEIIFVALRFVRDGRKPFSLKVGEWAVKTTWIRVGYEGENAAGDVTSFIW